MGLFDALFGGATKSASSDSEDTYLVSCRSCGNMVDEDDLEDGECEDCAEYLGPTYCCGRMYEDGETTCDSCGEPL